MARFLVQICFHYLTALFFVHPAIGSTSGLTGNNGTILNRYSYRPFGEDFYEVETVSNSFEYVGQFGVTEEQNGLDYMRARYYDSNLGRFSSIDPIGFQGRDTNLYRYVGNRPTNLVDPSGTVAIPVVPIVGGLAGVGTGYILGKIGTPQAKVIATGLSLGSAVLSKTFPASAPFLGTFGPGVGFGYALANLPPKFPQPLPYRYPLFDPKDPQQLPPFFPGHGSPFDPATGRPFVPELGGPGYLLPLKRGFPASGQLSSPLVLDLDNDGIELTNLTTSQTYFDIDGDGFREATGWVKADDGLLVRDVNNDGFINDNTELFGNNTAAQINSGFTKLKTLDSNADGWISATDTAFNSLKIWRDLDQDGISDTGELFTLNQLNISRISVNPTATNQTIEGNQILETAQYELTNGTQRTIVDAWFALDDMNSRYDFRSTQNAPVTLTNEILSLPNLKGYGTLPDLHIAMAKDPQLLTLVKDFTLKLNQLDLTSAKAMAQSILFRWAGVDSITSNSRGSYIDARKLTFLEKFIGRPWVPSWATDLSIGANPLPAQGQVLNQLYDQSESSLTGRLLIQHSVFNSAVSFDATTDQVTYLDTYESAIEQLDKISAQFVANPSPILELQQIELSTLLLDQQGYSLVQVGTGASDQIQPWFTSIYAFPFTSNVDSAVYGLAGNDTITTNSGNDVLYGGSGDDVLNGFSGNDLLLGGSGNDTLIGDANQDTLNGGLGNDFLQGGGEDDLYQYDKGQGSDVLLDAAIYSTTPVNAGNDTLEFGKNLGRNDLTWLFDGRNLTFSIVGSATDKISIQDYIDPNRTIEKITIAGTPLSLTDIMTAYEGQDINGLNTLSWQSSSIKFNGLAGDDNIIASPYDDTLFGGDGNDTIDGQGGNNFIDGGNGDDVLKGFGSSNTILGGLGNDSLLSGYGNDSLFGGDGNDILVSDQGNDLLDGGFGNDTLQGGYGDDTYLFSKGQG